jgi:hypothetical protein
MGLLACVACTRARALLQEPVHAGPRRHVLEAQQVGPAGDLPVEYVVSLDPEVEQSVHVTLVRARPGIVVCDRGEAGAAEHRRDVVEDRPEERVRGVGVAAGDVVV